MDYFFVCSTSLVPPRGANACFSLLINSIVHFPLPAATVRRVFFKKHTQICLGTFISKYYNTATSPAVKFGRFLSKNKKAHPARFLHIITQIFQHLFLPSLRCEMRGGF